MRSLAFNSLFWSLSAVFALVCYALAWLPWRRPVVAMTIGYAITVRACLHTVAGIRIEVRGTPPRGEPVIIAAKHQSYADGPIMLSLTGDLNFVIGNGIEKFPLIGRIVRKAGATMVNSQGQTRASGALHDSVERSLNDHRPILIYPEGGLSAVGETQRYRKGVHMLYNRLDRAVVPVATNLGLRWHREDWHKTPGLAVIEFLDPIPPGLPRENFMQGLQDAIETRTRALEAEGSS